MSAGFSLPVERTAHVATLGEVTDATREVWFVLHGYGQRAERFLREFEPVATDQRWILAPEGLSRFYLAGVTGRIGATWMTSAQREDEIADYVAYLDRVHARVREQLAGRDVRTHLLGFSQGTATASRWLARGEVRPVATTLWAGTSAPELDLAALPATRWSLVVGSSDEWITPDRIEREAERFAEARLPLRTEIFQGGHRIDATTLEGVAAAT